MPDRMELLAPAGDMEALKAAVQSGADAEELECAVREEYEIEDPAAVRSVIEAFLRQMLELNYLIAEDGKAAGEANA